MRFLLSGENEVKCWASGYISGILIRLDRKSYNALTVIKWCSFFQVHWKAMTGKETCPLTARRIRKSMIDREKKVVLIGATIKPCCCCWVRDVYWSGRRAQWHSLILPWKKPIQSLQRWHDLQLYSLFLTTTCLIETFSNTFCLTNQSFCHEHPFHWILHWFKLKFLGHSAFHNLQTRVL